MRVFTKGFWNKISRDQRIEDFISWEEMTFEKWIRAVLKKTFIKEKKEPFYSKRRTADKV